MRRLAAVAALLGLLAWFYRRRRPAPQPASTPDHAADLRRKLDETRQAEEPTLVDDLATRRRAVHAEGRAALDEMRGDTA